MSLYHLCLCGTTEEEKIVNCAKCGDVQEKGKDYVVYDTVEEWADFIFKEVNDGTLQMM